MLVRSPPAQKCSGRGGQNELTSVLLCDAFVLVFFVYEAGVQKTTAAAANNVLFVVVDQFTMVGDVWREL